MSRALDAIDRSLVPLTACDAPQPPHISFIDRSAAPFEGGTPITVHGSGFDDPMHCQFGDMRSPVEGIDVTAHRFVCPAPRIDIADTSIASRLASSPVQREVFEVGLRVATGFNTLAGWPTAWTPSALEPATLDYYNASTKLHVESLQPAGGPIEGGTMVTLRGPSFLYPRDAATRSHLRCHFEQHRVDANGSNETTAAAVEASMIADGIHVRCRSPPALVGEAFVALRYANLSSSAMHAQFHYYKLVAQHNVSGRSGDDLPGASESHVLSLSSVHPLGGPTAGGTVLTISGTGFRDFGGADPDLSVSLDHRPRQRLQSPFVLGWLRGTRH